ncbi:hypothetical protein V6N11_009877 [Hibiscus sabdariffa]|uniref:At3g05675-like ankyrin-like domain-containing protein n=2 Tax=Hibiscus sabdariffa TaxID=183260 RepID=A0ABR1ZXM2_9ROSI
MILIRASQTRKDEKARREMKWLVFKMLGENSSHNDLRKQSLYSASGDRRKLLRQYFVRAASADLQDASQSELPDAHSKVPVAHRYEISRATARLFVGTGKGQLLASKEVRRLLLQTWLVPF